MFLRQKTSAGVGRGLPPALLLVQGASVEGGLCISLQHRSSFRLGSAEAGFTQPLIVPKGPHLGVTEGGDVGETRDLRTPE